MEFHTPQRRTSAEQASSVENAAKSEQLEDAEVQEEVPEVPSYCNLIFDQSRLGGADGAQYLKQEMEQQRPPTTGATHHVVPNEVSESDEAISLEQKNKEIEDSKPKNFQ